MDPRKLAELLTGDVVEYRRHFHRNPELAYEEVRTTEYVARELERAGIAYRLFEPTGLLGTITGGNDGPTVLLRADMDALPIEEQSGACFASENKGVMHACGHDCHTAMLLGAARALQQNRQALGGTVKLLFQPAEEGWGGAQHVVGQGALDGVDMAFGLHIFSKMPVGSLWIGEGVCAASSDRFRIQVSGVSCHGAMPHQGADALVAAANLVTTLQGVVARELPPREPVALTVGMLQSGTAYNIVPDSAYIEGTTRTFNSGIRDRLPGIIERIATHVAQAWRCEAKTEYERNIDPLECDPAASRLARQAALEVAGNKAMVDTLPPMTLAEDFAEYTARVPGCFVGLGGGGSHPQHSAHFSIDEAALPVGVAWYIAVVKHALGRLKTE